MGLLGWIGDTLGLTSDRGDNPYAGVDQNNFQMPGGPGYQHQAAGYTGAAMQQQAPQLGPTQYAQQSGFRDQQGQLAQLLMAQAQGQNSIAQEQLRQAADRESLRQQSMASTGRGNAALQGRTAAQMMGNINQGYAGQAALAGLQERAAAGQQLGGLLQGARGQDEGLGMFNAQQGNQMNMGQAQLDQNQFGMNNSAAQGWMGLGQQAAGMQQQGNIAYETNRANRFGGMLGVPTSNEQMVGLGSSLLGFLGGHSGSGKG